METQEYYLCHINVDLRLKDKKIIRNKPENKIPYLTQKYLEFRFSFFCRGIDN